jgi:hypothetical protein
MPKGRVFFSHSTKDRSAERKALMAVATALEADDYEVLLDRTALEAGGNWRPIIDDWIRGCNAALIWITPGSIASQFCQYEWATLSFRRRMQKQFLILPVYLGSAPNDIKNRPDQISEISGYFGFGKVAAIIPDLKQRLAAEVDPKGELRTQVNLIADALRKSVREEVIETAARNLDIDLGIWDLAADKWLRFAIKIMGVGLLGSFGALQDLRRFFPKANEDEFRVIVELLARCSWVDAGSAQRIRACGLRDRTGRVLLGLNAEQEETAKCYVLTGSDKHPDDIWPVGIVLNDFGDDEAHLHKRVRSALVGALTLDDPDDAALKADLDYRRDTKQPVFVVLGAEGLSKDWLKRLREAELFEGVNFLLMTGKAGDARQLLPDDAILKPLLPAGFENKLWNNYARVKRDFKWT